MSKEETNKYFHMKSTDVPLYRGKLVIILSNDSDKITKQIPEFDKEDPYAHAWLVEHHKYQWFTIILNFHNKQRDVCHGTIAHEAAHAAAFILGDRGVAPDFINDEPVAYLIEWITNEVYKHMKKHNLKAVYR